MAKNITILRAISEPKYMKIWKYEGIVKCKRLVKEGIRTEKYKEMYCKDCDYDCKYKGDIDG